MQPKDILRRWIGSVGSQTSLASDLGVTRAAVSKWCAGAMAPSPERAEAIARLSEGKVPADIWPREAIRQGIGAGSRAIRAEAIERGLSISRLADECGISQRSLARWATGENAPRGRSLQMLNKALGLSLTAEDFEVTR